MIDIRSVQTQKPASHFFAEKSIKPMQVSSLAQPILMDQYMLSPYPLGIRCIAYLDEDSTELRSARNMRLLPLFPELTMLHHAALRKCIIDGFIAPRDEAEPPLHYGIQNRLSTTLSFAINQASQAYPVRFIAHDILHFDDEDLLCLPYLQRRRYLGDALNERQTLAFPIVLQQAEISGLSASAEKGQRILAKRKDGLYHPGNSSLDWIFLYATTT